MADIRYERGDKVRPNPTSRSFDELTVLYGSLGTVQFDDGDDHLPLFIDWGVGDPTWFDYAEVVPVEAEPV